MVSQVAPGGSQGVSMCRKNLLFQKLNICLGVQIYPSQGTPVSPTHRPISAKIDVQDMPPLVMIS